MSAPRLEALRFGSLLLATVWLQACASAGTNRYWTAFVPTSSNFQRHFDERGDVDPIEGIWVSRGLAKDTIVIVRDSSFEGFGYVGVRFPEPPERRFTVTRARDPADPDPIDRTAGTPAPSRAEIFMALGTIEGEPAVYEYRDAAVLRGATCSDAPCHGIYSIAADGVLRRQGLADERGQAGQGWVRIYPLP